MNALRHTRQVALRYIRALLRQPAWVGISLVQPVIWLLLFGALFKRTSDIPGFTGGSYIEFLTPGVIVMLAVSTAGWVGTGTPGILTFTEPRWLRLVKYKVFQSSPPNAILVVAGAPWTMRPSFLPRASMTQMPPAPPQ